MKHVDIDIRRLAILYFEGKISRTDEKCLLDFIQCNESNRTQFKRWEQEWIGAGQENADVVNE